MNDTAQVIITVLLALLGIATMLYLWIESVKEGQCEAETRVGKSKITRGTVIHQFPDGTERRIS